MMQQKARALRINVRDNVAIALEDIPAGMSVSIAGLDGKSIIALQSIPFAHKIAICPIKRGEPILKYGVPIAFALTEIAMGDWIHEHNAKSYIVAKREGETP
jgi:altronate dehydratase